jgi:hypothetical protein
LRTFATGGDASVGKSFVERALMDRLIHNLREYIAPILDFDAHRQSSHDGASKWERRRPLNLATELLRSVEDFEKAIQESYSLGDEYFDAKRLRGVELRRSIVARSGEISRLGERFFSDTPELGDFRMELAKMRSAMAEHHASWPLVRIDLSDPRFRASSQALREATRHFIGWLRQAVVN